MWQSSSTVGAFSGPREASVLFGLWCDPRYSRRGVRPPHRQFRTVRENGTIIGGLVKSSSTIDRWGIVQLYCTAQRKQSWIECICLGYTMLEMALRYLLKSKAGPSGQPLPDSKIERCRYLMDLAALARDEGFLSQPIFDEIDSFNESRIKAIHKLLSETVTHAELQETAKSISSIYGKIQDLWLKITIGPEETCDPSKHSV